MDAEEEGRVSAPGPTLLFDMEEEGGVSAPSPHLLFDDARIASPSWVYRIYIFLSLATLSQFMLAPISPDIVRAPFHVSMCPNITAAIDHSLTPGGSGYVVTAAQDSGRGLFKLAGAFVAGWACDKIGRKPVMLLGAIGDAVPMFTIAMTCDTAFYIPLNTVMGFFDSFVTVAVATFIADVVPAPERAAAYGRMFVPALVVLLVGSPLIGKLALATMNSNIQLLFTITAALSILPIIFSLCFIPETLGCKIPGDVPVPPVIVPKLSIAGAGDEREEETPGHFSAPQSLLTLALASILFLNFIVSMATGGEQAMLFLYMANNFPECTVECRSFLMSAISITVIFSSLILLPISLRFLRRMWTLRLALVGRVAVLTTLMLARDVDWIFISLSFVLLANFFTIVIMDLAATTAPKVPPGSKPRAPQPLLTQLLLRSRAASDASCSLTSGVLSRHACRREVGDLTIGDGDVWGGLTRAGQARPGAGHAGWDHDARNSAVAADLCSHVRGVQELRPPGEAVDNWRGVLCRGSPHLALHLDPTARKTSLVIRSTPHRSRGALAERHRQSRPGPRKDRRGMTAMVSGK